METTYRRGDIFFAALGDGAGSEQGGDRPVVIIQNDTGNRHSPTVIVAPFTTKGDRKPRLPTHCHLCDVSGLDADSTVLLEQIRTVDKQRLQKKLGHLSKHQMESIDQGILISLGFIRPQNDAIEICLCRVCLDNFRLTGKYKIRRKNEFQSSRNICTYCNHRTGFDYVLLAKQNEPL